MAVESRTSAEVWAHTRETGKKRWTHVEHGEMTLEETGLSLNTRTGETFNIPGAEIQDVKNYGPVRGGGFRFRCGTIEYYIRFYDLESHGPVVGVVLLVLKLLVSREIAEGIAGILMLGKMRKAATTAAPFKAAIRNFTA